MLVLSVRYLSIVVNTKTVKIVFSNIYVDVDNKSVPANAQYSTTVQQPQKPAAQPQTQSKMVQQATGVSELKPETKKYAFLLDKGSTNTPKKLGPQFRKVMPNIIGKSI